MRTTLLTVGLIILVQMGLPGDGLPDEPLTTQCKVKGVTYLDQGPAWRDRDRCLFYHLSQEARLIRYDWFLALEAPHTPGENFASQKNLAQYGMLSDESNRAFNNDNLPVGLAKANNVRPPQIGFNCAFCHTGELVYKGKRYRVDGGPSLQQNFKFLKDLATALALTLSDQAAFTRFAERVLKEASNNPIQDSPELLKKLLHDEMIKEMSHLTRLSRIESADWGAGRFDALGRGGNMIYHESQWGLEGMPRCNPLNTLGPDYKNILGCDGIRALNAPVSIPSLWRAWEQDWLLWNGSMQNPTARAMVEGLSIDTKLRFDHPDDPFPVDVKKLIDLDNLGRKIGPPRWPKDHFGPIVQSRVKRGKQLFHGDPATGKKGLCAGCHVPTQLEKPTVHDQHWKVTMSPISNIGTDPVAAMNFHHRSVQLGPFGWRSISDATKFLTGRVMRTNSEAMSFGGKTPAQIVSNPWRSCVTIDKSPCAPSYKARPLDGIWATAPFLHNGSIPSLYELLSPRSQRTPCFLIGPGIEFDTAKLGLTVSECTGRWIWDPTSDFEFDTSKPGNSNAGHEFKNVRGCESFLKKGGVEGVLGCEIKQEDREAIIEYLKTLETPLPPSVTTRNQTAQLPAP